MGDGSAPAWQEFSKSALILAASDLHQVNPRAGGVVKVVEWCVVGRYLGAEEEFDCWVLVEGSMSGLRGV